MIDDQLWYGADEEWVSAEPREATYDEILAITGYALGRWFP